MRKKWNSEEMKEAARDARRALERERERMMEKAYFSGICSVIFSCVREFVRDVLFHRVRHLFCFYLCIVNQKRQRFKQNNYDSLKNAGLQNGGVVRLRGTQEIIIK
jgi:hypothetical protein